MPVSGFWILLAIAPLVFRVARSMDAAPLRTPATPPVRF
jgi:hypothetical protein